MSDALLANDLAPLLDSQAWDNLPASATCFFQCKPLGVHRSQLNTTARYLVQDGTLHVRFDCPLHGSPATTAPQKPVGDPDIHREGEYVRVVIQRDDLRNQAHWTVTCDGQGHSEHGDRRIIGDDQWRFAVEQGDDRWSATLALPLSTLAPHAPGDLRFYLIRCSPKEGITAWPTPFAGWLHAHPEAFVPFSFSPLQPDALEQRCHELRRALHATCRSFPNDVEDWHEQMASLLRPDVAVHELSQTMHARASAKPRRPFMDLLDRLSPTKIEPAALIEALDALDAEDKPRLRELSQKWGLELLSRGEPMMVTAYVYHLTGNEELAARVRLSLERMLERWPLQCGLQRLSPDGHWASSLNFYNMGLAIRAMHLLCTRAPQDNDLLLRLLKLAHEGIYFGDKTVHHVYHFNHSINWADKVIEIASLCPEMRAADDWLELGWKHMANALDAQILPDGISQELCSGYNLVAYMRLTEAIEACEGSGIAVPPAILKRAEQMLEASTVHLLPNGATAGFGDGRMGCDDDGYVAGRRKADRHLTEGGKRFNRPDLLWLGTHGREGTPPTHTDTAKRWAGAYAARTGWTADDFGLILDAGPLGRAHAHDDRLGFVYSYKARCLVVDGHYDMEPARRVFTNGPTAHSTVCVDGFASDYLGRFEKWVNKAPQQDRFERIDNLYYLEATHHLIHKQDESQTITVHRRIITQLDRFICIIDHVTGDGRQNVHSRLQLPRGQVVLDGPRFRTTTGRIDLAGMHLGDVPFTQEFGDWAHGPDQQVTLKWSQSHAALPLTQAVLLLPFENGELTFPQVKAQLTAGPCQVDITWPDAQTQTLRWP